MAGIRNDAVKQAVKQAMRQGWTLETRGSGHWCLRSPDGATGLIFSATMTNQGRGPLNTIALFKRAGIQL